ncbi:type II toxin-antitoxin system HicB family antitoxin [Roseateles terrae]|uniref:Antitoxin HicB n=1 Tax=Roseateles terrae TaxID=431060 RepID=A0ABR6GS09_9BURK|nr:type II toxin-antitoxin system HicB family antitoxin [Roseateles terrae]MBB3193918.1 antitoxin HicB [Roseateles terrae]OWQ87797.1 antitoxin [Roseateles terrae]
MKNRFSFPAKFEPDADTGGYVVTFRDIPEAITQGDSLEDARAMALDALATAMEFYQEEQRAVPEPSALEPGEELVTLPVSMQAKLLLLNEMVAQKIRPADLARAMGIKPQEVTRLLDLGHTTKIDALAAAFTAIGRTLALRVE